MRDSLLGINFSNLSPTPLKKREKSGIKCICGEGNGNPLQYSCLENPRDGGAWWATVHRVAKSQTRLSDFTFIALSTSQVTQWQGIRLPKQDMQVLFLGQEDPLEKVMATHSSILAWEIPWPEDPGG